MSIENARAAPAPSSTPVLLLPGDHSRRRWLASSVLGLVLGVGAIVLSQVVPALFLGELQGLDFALVGLLQLLLVPIGIRIGLRPVGLSLSEIGVRGPNLLKDSGIGIGVAGLFALLQFSVLIPATGGRAREDVVTNMAQIGGDLSGVIGVTVLALTGVFAEELLFRGHLLTTLRNGLGRSRAALVGAVAVVTLVFGLLHGYQGWSGIIDTSLYGGVTLSLLFIATRGRIAAAFLAHASWNIIAVLVMHRWAVTG